MGWMRGGQHPALPLAQPRSDPPPWVYCSQIYPSGIPTRHKLQLISLAKIALSFVVKPPVPWRPEPAEINPLW